MTTRDDMRASFVRSLERQARRHTDRLLREASQLNPEHLEVKIAGAMRQAAYMNIGWHPESESPATTHKGHQLGHTLLTLRLDRPAGGW